MAQMPRSFNSSNQELSSRELQVIEQIKLGKSNKEIAHALCITESTVKKHVSSIFKVLNVNSRLELLSRLINK